MLLREQRRWTQLLLVLTAVLTASCSSDDADRSATPVTTSTSVAADAPATAPEPPAPSCEVPEPEPRPGLDTVVGTLVFCGDPVGPPSYVIARRLVPDDGAPLRAALEQLLVGVTPAEAEAGLASSFSSFTAGQLVDVDLSNGLATIEWTPGWVTTNNFSTSTLSGIVMEQVAGTAFQFENVDGIEFIVDGARWCGWETTCEGMSSPRISRAEFAPPECVQAWRTGATAPIRCEDLVAAYTITMAAVRGR